MHPVLTLGSTPLANSLLNLEQLEQPEAHYPLEVEFCEACYLVQITETVPSESLFRDYFYFSSFSETMLEHSRAIALRLIRERLLTSQSLVVEIASNDGYLLQNYKQSGIPVLGIEPARNVARVASEKNHIRTLPEFFTKDLAGELAEQDLRADVVHANNVLAHVPDLNGFVAGIQILLKEDGVAVIEVPYLVDLIDHSEFDTIYHEHLCYFSLHALKQLFLRNGLVIAGVEQLAIHGGSVRLFATRRREHSVAYPAVESLLNDELCWGVDRRERYDQFRDRVAEIAESLRRKLCELKSDGKQIAIYGASAKGCSLLSYLSMPPGFFSFVVDRSPHKQGYYTPGTHLKIFHPDKLCEARPDFALLLTWNFADEILSQQSEFRALGGKFIIPLPELRVV